MKQQRELLEDCFGGCPYCGGSSAIRNLGKDHFAYCNKHKTYWYVGSKLFSGWKDENQEDWNANEEFLKGMVYVQPIQYKDEIIHLDETCQDES